MTRHTRRCVGSIVAVDARCIGVQKQNLCFVAFRRENELPFFVTEPQAGPQACWGDYNSRPIVPVDDFSDKMRLQGGLQWRNMLVSLWIEDINSTSSSRWHCVWEHAVDFTSVKPVGHHVRLVIC